MRPGVLSRSSVFWLLTLGSASALEAAGPVAPMPIGSPGTWATSNDYPPEALRNKVEGISGFRVEVSKNGLPVGCEIISSSGSAILDEKTCQLVLARAQFSSPLDEKGRPTTGTYTNRVRWLLPQSQPLPEPGSLVYSYVIEADGNVTNCKIVEAEGGAVRPDLSATVCRVEGLKYQAFQDANGEPQRKQIIITHTVKARDVDP